MDLNSKATPKSCGCRQCRHSKRTNKGHFFMRADQRSYRQAARLQLRLISEDDDSPLPAPRGGRYG
jgi:hypothetical protein